MNDFRDDFERQLLGAARALPPATNETARSRRSRRIAVGALASVAVTGSALAAVHPWSPQLGNDRFNEPRPQQVGGGPMAAQLQRMAVFRRAPQPSDRGKDVREVLRALSGIFVRGVETDAVRRVAVDRGALVLIPARSWRPGLDARERRDVVCVVPDLDGATNQTRACWTTQDILEGHAVASLGHVLFGLVPDGVATVRLELAGGIAPSAPVSDNAFALQADNLSNDPEAEHAAGAVDRVRWLDAQGDDVGPPGQGDAATDDTE